MSKVQHDNHVTRRAYALHLKVYEVTMAKGNFGHPDKYYGWKNRERELAGALKGVSSAKNDPMYFHHGGMGN